MESYDAAKVLHSFCNLHIELCQLSVLAHVELEQTFCSTSNQVPWLCKGRSKNNNRYGLHGWSLTRKKIALKCFTSFVPAHIRKTAASFLAKNKAYY